MFSIADFRAHLEPLGILKPSKFKVTILVPGGLVSSQDFSSLLTGAREMEFWATAAMLPGMDVITSPIRTFGYGAIDKRPWAPAFGECQVLFNCDAKGLQWSFFKTWLNYIYNFDTSHGINSTSTVTNGALVAPYETSYKEDYLSYAYIQVFSDDGTLVLTTALNETYPISVSNMRLDWGAGDQVAQFSVQMTYRDWFNIPSDAQIGFSTNILGFQITF